MSRFAHWITFAGLLLLTGHLHAQVRASSSKPLSVYGYGMATAADNELGYGKALGGSGGLIADHGPLFGLDARGVIIRARQPLHTYIAEVGPRVSHRFWLVKPYGEVLFGLGHSGYLTPEKQLVSGYGLTYSVAVGADLRLFHGFSWRVADLSYNHISAGPGETAKLASMGVVYHFF